MMEASGEMSFKYTHSGVEWVEGEEGGTDSPGLAPQPTAVHLHNKRSLDGTTSESRALYNVYDVYVLYFNTMP